MTKYHHNPAIVAESNPCAANLAGIDTPQPEHPARRHFGALVDAYEARDFRLATKIRDALRRQTGWRIVPPRSWPGHRMPSRGEGSGS
jgi:hypothetical protein